MVWIYFRHRILRLRLLELLGVLAMLLAEAGDCVGVKRQVLVDVTVPGTGESWTRSSLCASLAARTVQTFDL